jgi:hypothetical protein
MVVQSYTVYKVPRRLFCRGKYRLEGKCCCYGEISLVWKVLITPHTSSAQLMQQDAQICLMASIGRVSDEGAPPYFSESFFMISM